MLEESEDLYVSLEDFLACCDQIERETKQKLRFPLNDEEEDMMIQKIRYISARRDLGVRIGKTISLVYMQEKDSSRGKVKRFFHYFTYSEKLKDMTRRIEHASLWLSPTLPELESNDARILWEYCIPMSTNHTALNIGTEIKAFGWDYVDGLPVITCISRSYRTGEEMIIHEGLVRYRIHNYVLGRSGLPIWEEMEGSTSVAPLNPLDNRYFPQMGLQSYLDDCLKLSGGLRNKILPSQGLPVLRNTIPDEFALLKCLEDKAFSPNALMSNFDPGSADVLKCRNRWFSNDVDIKRFRQTHQKLPKKAPGDYVSEDLALSFFDLVRTLIRRDFQVSEFNPRSTIFRGKDKFVKGTRDLPFCIINTIKYTIHQEGTLLEGEMVFNIYPTYDYEISEGGIPLSNVNLRILTQPVFVQKKYSFKRYADVDLSGDDIVYQGDMKGRPFVKDMFVP